MTSFNPQKLTLPTFNEAQVLTILAEISSEVEGLKEQVHEARLTADSTKDQLEDILRRQKEYRALVQNGDKAIQELSEKIGAENDQILSLHQDVAILKSQAEEMRQEIAKLGRNAATSKLKRERARINIRIEDKEAELGQLKPQVELERQQLNQLETDREENNYRFRATQKELDDLQSTLPSPYLYTDLYQAVTKEAHANYYLDHDVLAWKKSIWAAFPIMYNLSSDIRLGKYRLDRYSDVIGGRSLSSVEALYSAVLLGKTTEALNFFETTCDNDLFFHNIFNVFRCWIMGFYLRQDKTNLRELLRYYAHSNGLRLAYVEAFTALLDHNQLLFDRAIRFIARFEFSDAQSGGQQLISIGGLTLASLALRNGLSCNFQVQTIPLALLGNSNQRQTK